MIPYMLPLHNVVCMREIYQTVIIMQRKAVLLDWYTSMELSQDMISTSSIQTG